MKPKVIESYTKQELKDKVDEILSINCNCILKCSKCICEGTEYLPNNNKNE